MFNSIRYSLVAAVCLGGAAIFASAVEPADDAAPPPRRGPQAGPQAFGNRPPPPFRPRPGDRMGQGPRDDGPRDDGPPPLTQEMIDNAMQMVQEKFPILHARLTRLQQNDPQRFEQAMHRLMFIHHEYQALKQNRADMAEKMIEGLRAEEKLYSLSDQYKAAEGDAQKQAALDQQITDVVRQQTQIMQQRRQERLDEFAQRLVKQQLRLDDERKRFEEEKANVDQLIARRVENIKQGKIKPGIIEGGPPPGPGGGPGPDGRRRPPPPPFGHPPGPPPDGDLGGPDGPPDGPMHPDDEPPPSPPED